MLLFQSSSHSKKKAEQTGYSQLFLDTSEYTSHRANYHIKTGEVRQLNIENCSLLGAEKVTDLSSGWYEQLKGNRLIAGDRAWTSMRDKNSWWLCLTGDLALSWVLPPGAPTRSLDNNGRKKSPVLHFEIHSECSLTNKSYPQEKLSEFNQVNCF